MKDRKRRFMPALLVAAMTAILSLLPVQSAANASISTDERLGNAARYAVTLDLRQIFGAKSSDAVGKVLIPGGQAVGVAIRTQGVVVVGLSDSAGMQAGLRAGDILLSVNGRPLDSADILTETIDAAQGQPLSIVLDRDGKQQTVLAAPVFDEESQRYRLGVWVRDSTAGVGTLTFYDPQTYSYGALGHAIIDSDTGLTLPVREGRLMQAEVVGVRRGERGMPGELKGSFLREQVRLGSVESNGAEGIYGKMDGEMQNALYPEGLPVGARGEVHTGAATILSTVDGSEMLEYSVEITQVNRGSAQKSMVIRVTDERLLQATGGIVQGMSGSPIIQDGKIIGAVTHVFVNEPTKGYGIFIESMLEKAG